MRETKKKEMIDHDEHNENFETTLSINKIKVRKKRENNKDDLSPDKRRLIKAKLETTTAE